VTKILYNK